MTSSPTTSLYDQQDQSPLLNSSQTGIRNYQTLTDRQPQENGDFTAAEARNNEQTHSANVSIASTLNEDKTRHCHFKRKRSGRSIFTHEFWEAAFQKYSTSVYLENKGSVARDHLANERTYLAWVRTSLSTVSVGIGLTQLFRLENKAKTPDSSEQSFLVTGQMVGFLFIIISMLFILFAFLRFFHAQVSLMKGYFPATRSTVVFASCTLFLTMFGMLIIVVKQS